MEAATNNRLPLIGIEILKKDQHLETRVYRKKTNKGLLLHFESHIDSLTSTQEFFSQECQKLKRDIFFFFLVPGSDF